MPLPRALVFLAALLCVAALPRAAAADKKIPAPSEYNAALPISGWHIQLRSDQQSDYFVDDIFSQFVRENPDGIPEGSELLNSPDTAVPSWTTPLPSQAILQKDGIEFFLFSGWDITLRDGLLLLLETESDDENTPPERHRLFFSGPRWLAPGDVVQVFYSDEDDDTGGFYIKTTGGLSLLTTRLMTLEQKALHFEQVTQARHNRDGMISDCTLTVPGDLSSYKLRDDDNDGQWSEMYLAAESFRWADTHDPEALANARKTFRAMIKLLTIAPVKGFPARSVLPAAQCPGADAHNWRMLPDGSECWKSDTSVDELVGHYFGLPIYYDLAADDAEKQIIRQAVADMTDYLLDNGLRLVDESGQVTTDGHWDPEWVNSVGRTGDQGLNSAQALNALLSAHHITGDAKYRDAYLSLIKDHGYHKNALKWKEIGDRFQVNHDSDEMGFLSFYNLLRYEDDESIRKFYLEGLRRAWENDLPERNPEQILIYGAFAQKDFRLDLAVRTLMEIPLDLVKWSVRNSGRADLPADPDPDRMGKAQSAFVPPYTETRTMRWSENMYQLDVDDAGRSEAMPVFWLLPYWMARYHGFIRNPQTAHIPRKD